MFEDIKEGKTASSHICDIKGGKTASSHICDCVFY